MVSEALQEKLATEVTVRGIELRLPNRIIVDGLTANAHFGKRMLQAGRVSATISLLPLFDGRIFIPSAQVFGMQATLYKQTPDGQINCQFVIDSLKSKDSSGASQTDLSIGSLVIRNSEVKYDEWYEPQRSGNFSPHHIDISRLSAHITLDRLYRDSIQLTLKRLSLHEHSGLDIKKLRADVTMDSTQVSLDSVILDMPASHIFVRNLTASRITPTATQGKGKREGRLQVQASRLTPNDFASLLPDGLAEAMPPIDLDAWGSYDAKGLQGYIRSHSLGGRRFAMDVSGNAQGWGKDMAWHADIKGLRVAKEIIAALGKLLKLPEIVQKLGDVEAHGTVAMAGRHSADADFTAIASDIGEVRINGQYANNRLTATITTPQADLATITGSGEAGSLTADVKVNAIIPELKRIDRAEAEGTLSNFFLHGYTYRQARFNARYNKESVEGDIEVDDPNAIIRARTQYKIKGERALTLNALVRNLSPAALHLTNQLGDDRVAMDISADVSGLQPDNILGTVALRNVSLTDPIGSRGYSYLDALAVSLQNTDDGQQQLSVQSDFVHLLMYGRFSPGTLTQTMTNLIARHLPNIPGLPAVKPTSDDFTLSASVKDLSFVKRIIPLPLDLQRPLTIKGYVNAPSNMADITLSAPSLSIGGMRLSSTEMDLSTQQGHLAANVFSKLSDDKGDVSMTCKCVGQDDVLTTTLAWDNNRQRVFRGELNTQMLFTPLTGGQSDVEVTIPPSSFLVGDTTWSISSRRINYKRQRLTVDHLAIENGHQHLIVDGYASPAMTDTICADFRNLNIEYILNLINFHSVQFEGEASGHAEATGVMGQLSAMAEMDVQNFKFETGRLGALRVKADYNSDDNRINIDGLTDDPNGGGTIALQGYITPSPAYIDLDMKADSVRMEFLGGFCGSFMSDVNMHGTGDIRLHGPFSALELEGKAAVSGGMTLSATNVRYWAEGDTLAFLPGDIVFNRFRLRDRFNNHATVSGGVHHTHLGNIAYDLTAETDRLLAYDMPDIPEGETYCGYAIIDGTVGISGSGNEVNISANCTPLAGTFFTYNASSPEAIMSQDFITWGSARQRAIDDSLLAMRHQQQPEKRMEDDLNAGNDRTNIRMNFEINATPEARLHLIMDQTTGDYIDLFGNGSLQVQYYNKGSLDIFGNYTVDQGVYKMTIQNLIRRDFSFSRGGTIGFGGDPYNATLNLQAVYKLNSVSLADLNIGSSFKSNNVPVSCLMNISGTPEAPIVAFDLDLPSLSSDAMQMVQSVINSEEEMNQQVLYLLAVGRFYSQSGSNDASQRTTQSSLAMQSFLSGTVSGQLSNILSDVINNNNWTIGANITPGSDGFNMGAEYEGVLSGRMFNNRLLFDGQFGYRDNITTNTQNFIGDFSLQYLLTPNGSLSLKVYNQANDRYFTPSSLNTQGIGLVMQKEFKSLKDIFRWRRKKVETNDDTK